MATKYVTGAIGAVGANTQQGPQALPTVGDDAKVRRVTGMKASLSTKGMTIQALNNGVFQAQIDAAILNQVLEFAPVDFTVAANIALAFSVFNQTGGALAAGDFVTLRYEVP